MATERASRGTPLLLTQLVRSDLLSPAGERLGRVDDVIVRLDSGGYPRVTGLRARVGDRTVFVPVEDVAQLGPGIARVTSGTLNVGQFARRPGEVLLQHDVLDRPIIDVNAGKLVTANDLLIARVDDGWQLVGVDPSPRGVLRRLLPGALRRSETLPPAAYLDWAAIQPFVGHVPESGLIMPLRAFARLHPAQIADLIERSSHEQGEEIIGAVRADPELTADVFEELEPEEQKEFLESQSDADAAAVLARMAPDDAVDLLGELDQGRRAPVLDLVPQPQARKLRALLQYHPGTAGGMMSPDFIAVERSATCAEALERIRNEDKAPAQLLGTVFLVEPDGRLVGTLTAADVVRGQPFERVDSLPGVSSRGVPLDADLQDVALMMTDFNLVAVGVVDRAGLVVGAISVDDLLEVLLPPDWRRRAEAESNV
ncbi:MAG TPA: CBS domain-containing protein [Chloroflexota bacterium]